MTFEGNISIHPIDLSTYFVARAKGQFPTQPKSRPKK